MENVDGNCLDEYFENPANGTSSNTDTLQTVDFTYATPANNGNVKFSYTVTKHPIFYPST